MTTRRKLLFSAVMLLLVLSLPELAVRLSGYTPSASALDVESTNRTFYVEDRTGAHGDWFLVEDGQARSNPGLVPQGFHDYTFPVDPGGVRLFAFGGSTTHGVPFTQRERGFPERLEGLLRGRGQDVEIINVGVAGMSSASFPELAREAVALGAAGFLIYSGNNEYMRWADSGCHGGARTQVERLLNSSYAFLYLRSWYRAFRPPVVMSADEILVHQEACTRTRALEAEGDAVMDTVVSEYRANLTETLDIAAAAGLPVWLAKPAVNLQEPPNLSVPERGDASARFKAGMLKLRGGDVVGGREALEEALDRDVLPLRPPRSLRAVIPPLCEGRESVTCVDVGAAFDAASADIPGYDLFVDFCHPTFEEGVSLIAEAFAEEMVLAR